MLTLPPVLMLIKCRSVKACKAVFVLRKMCRNPVHYYAHSVSVTAVYEIFKIVGLTKAACRCIISGNLIAPASVKGIFRNRHKLDMCIAHFLDIFNKLIRKFFIGKKSVVFLRNSHPASEIYFIYIERLTIYVAFFSFFEPFAVLPVVNAQIINDRCLHRSYFGIKSEGIAFINCFSVSVLYSEFILIELCRFGNKKLPYSRIAEHTHLCRSSVPVIERTDYAYAFCIGCPYSKGNAVRTVNIAQVSTELFIYFVMRSGTV